MKVLLIGSYSDADTARLTRAFSCQRIPEVEDLATMSDADRSEIRAVAFKGHTALNGAAMDLLPGLKLIANYGVGYDSIDVEAASARGVRVTNTPDVLNDDVADLAVAMLLMQTRQLRAAETRVRNGDWASGGKVPLARKASGLRAGIVGLGRIGRDIATRLEAFHMPIHYHSRNEKHTPGWTYHSDPVALAKAVDVLVVALVGGSETRHYVSRDVIEALGPDGILINIARGSCVDEAALLDALESRRIAGAGLDVFENEPNVDPRFLALENVVLLPHIGSATHQTRQAMAQLQRDNIAALLAGRDVLTPVN